jgi:hypothetical protein
MVPINELWTQDLHPLVVNSAYFEDPSNINQDLKEERMVAQGTVLNQVVTKDMDYDHFVDIMKARCTTDDSSTDIDVPTEVRMALKKLLVFGNPKN